MVDQVLAQKKLVLDQLVPVRWLATGSRVGAVLAVADGYGMRKEERRSRGGFGKSWQVADPVKLSRGAFTELIICGECFVHKTGPYDARTVPYRIRYRIVSYSETFAFAFIVISSPEVVGFLAKKQLSHKASSTAAVHMKRVMTLMTDECECGY